MKKNTTTFLQIATVLVGIGTLAFLLLEPNLEGRNVNSTLFEVYFKDPFLAIAYTASIAFFVALYQAFKVFGFIGQNNTFSQATAKALRTIKYCGRILVGFILAGEAYLVIVRPEEDIAGGIFMGLIAIVIFGAIAIMGARFEKVVQNEITT
jgi:hypothetical protein